MENKKLRASEVLPSVKSIISSLNFPEDISEIKEKLETIQGNLVHILRSENAESRKKYIKDDIFKHIYQRICLPALQFQGKIYHLSHAYYS